MENTEVEETQKKPPVKKKNRIKYALTVGTLLGILMIVVHVFMERETNGSFNNSKEVIMDNLFWIPVDIVLAYFLFWYGLDKSMRNGESN